MLVSLAIIKQDKNIPGKPMRLVFLLPFLFLDSCSPQKDIIDNLEGRNFSR